MRFFDIYNLYEQASGAKLKASKSKGLWLGPWANRTDPPLPLDWTNEAIPCLGTILGPDLPPSRNWDKRITSLSNVFDLWQQLCLSFQGKSLVSNALALSGLWSTATVLALPDNLLSTINQLLFKFIWSNKKELVARSSMYLSQSSGGFGVVDVRAKILAIHAQWIKRFVLSRNKWSAFFIYYVQSAFGVSVHEVLSFPAFYPSSLLLPFFSSVLEAWALLGGHTRGDGFFLRPQENGTPRPLANSTTKLCYSILAQQTAEPPHCILKFAGSFGPLFWSETWKQVHIMPLDRHVIDTNWKIAHGVIYTADRLVSFGMAVDPTCHCTNDRETLQHLFFGCVFTEAVLEQLQLFIM